MSTINVSNLKSPVDPTIPSFQQIPENTALAFVGHDTLLEFGLIGKAVRVINNDGVNNMEVRLHNLGNTPIIIPPSSEQIIQEWFSQIFITPDAGTGTGQITLELAQLKDAMRSN